MTIWRFYAGVGANGTEGLFVSNGTAAGTVQIAVPGAASTGVNPYNIVQDGSYVAFAGAAASGSGALFLYNGTTGKASQVSVTGAPASGLDPWGFTVVGSQLLFSGTDANGNAALFSLNPSTGAAAEISVSGGAANLQPFNFTPVSATQMLFAASTAAGGVGLFEYSTSTGTAAPVAVTGGAATLTPTDLTLVGTNVVFRGFNAAGTYALFNDNLTTSAATPVTFTTAGVGAKPGELTPIGTYVLFVGSTASGTGLFQDNTTTNTATQVTVSNGGSALDPFDLLAVGSQLLFLGTDAGGQIGLFSDTPSTGVSREITSSAFWTSQGPTSILATGTLLLFDDPLSASTSGLYSYNAATGTGGLVSVASAGANLAPANLTTVGGYVLFTGTGADGAQDLFGYNTATQTAVELTLTNALASGADPIDLQSNGTTVSFYAYDQSGFLGDWSSDGTQAGTKETGAPGKPINPELFASNVVAVNGDLLFQAWNTSQTNALFSYNPATGSASLVSTAAATGRFDASDEVVVGGQLLFKGTTAAGAAGLFTYTPGTGASAQVTIAGAAAPFVSGPMLVSGSQVLFEATDANGKVGLFDYSDISGSATELVVTASAAPTGFLEIGSQIFYTNGQLCSTNITTGVTTTIDPSAPWQEPNIVAAVSGTLVFEAVEFTPTYQYILAAENTVTGVVTQINIASSPNGGFSPTDFTTIGNQLFFVDNNDKTKLWACNPAAATATAVTVASAAASLDPTGLVAVGSLLFFSGNDSSGNVGLFRLNTATGVAAEVQVGAGLTNLSASNFTAFGSSVYFTGTSPAGTSLYVYNPVNNSASLAVSLVTILNNNVGNFLYTNTVFSDFSVVGSQILFSADEPNGNDILCSFTPSTGVVAEVPVSGGYDQGPNQVQTGPAIAAITALSKALAPKLASPANDIEVGGGAEAGVDNGGDDNGNNNGVSNNSADNSSASFALPPLSVTLAGTGIVTNGGTAVLGTATGSGVGDTLQVTLTSDARLTLNPASLTITNGTIDYAPGLITASQAGTDTLGFTVTDTQTGASVTQTQTVILSNGPAPVVVPVAQTPSVSNAGTVALASAAAGFGSDPLQLRLVSDSVFGLAGQPFLSGGTIEYTPGLITAANAGTDTITYVLTDTTTGSGTTKTQTVTLVPSPAPSVTLLTGPLAFNGLTTALATATPGYGTDALAATLTADSVFGTGAGVALTIVNGTVDYTPALITPANARADTIAYTVTDTVTGEVTSETQTVTLRAGSSVAITGVLPASGPSGIATVLPFAGVTVTDQLAGQTETATVTLSSAGNGTLANLAGGSFNATTGVYRVIGSAAAVTAAIDGLQFTQTASLVAQGQTITTGFTIAVTDAAGQSATNAGATVIETSPYPVLAITSVAQAAQPVPGVLTPYLFTVTRSGTVSGATTANWAVIAGGVPGTLGAAASDFTGNVLPSGTLSFAAGQTTQTITVGVTGAQAIGYNDSFTVALSGASSGAQIINATDAGIIFGPSTGLALGRTPVSAQPQGGTVTPYVFTVTRSGSTSAATTANWAVTAGGVAGTLGAAASDFIGGGLPAGTVTFAAGQTTQTITVNVAGAQAVGYNDSFTLALSNASSGAAITNATQAGIIFGYSTGISLSARPVSAQPPGGAPTPYVFTVTRSGNTSAAATANWAVTAGGVAGTLGAAASDFTGGVLPSGTVSFAAGQTTQTITVNVAGAQAAGFNDSFTLALSNASSGTGITNATEAGIIFGYGTAIALSATPVAAQPPGGSVTPYVFTVTRSGNTAAAATANWAVTAGGVAGTLGAAASDFTGGVLPSGTVSFAAGQTTQTITVNVAGAQAAGFNDSFTLALSNASSGTGITNATESGIILGYGTAIALSATPVAAQPPGGSVTPYVFTVTRSGSTAAAATANWAVTAGGVAGTLGAAASDFAGGVLPSGTVSFAAGQTTQTITVNVAGAQAAGFNDSFRLTLSNASSGTGITNATESGIIFGYPTALAITAAKPLQQAASGSLTPYIFTVTRSGVVSGATTAIWSVSGGTWPGTLAAGAKDFSGNVLPSGTVTFAAGQVSQTITINVAGVGNPSFNDSFAVNLSNPSTGTELGTATAGAVILAPATSGEMPLAAPPMSEPTAAVTPETLSTEIPAFAAPPTVLTLDGSAQTVDVRFDGGGTVVELQDFQLGLDTLDIDLGGAASQDLVGFNTSVNGQSAVVLTTISDLAQGVVLMGLGTGQTACGILADHATFRDGHALIS